MTYIQYPKVTAETLYGTVQLAFTNGDHVHVSTNAHVNDDAPTIVYRGTEYLLSLHLYVASDWDEGDDTPSSYAVTQRAMLNTKPAPKTHRQAIVDAVRVAVRSYVAEHPDVLREAAYAAANNDRDYAIGEVEKAAKVLADAHAELDKAEARMAASAPADRPHVKARIK